jgi:hypothetical protein
MSAHLANQQLEQGRKEAELVLHKRSDGYSAVTMSQGGRAEKFSMMFKNCRTPTAVFSKSQMV